MNETPTIFTAAQNYDFAAVRQYLQNGGDVNVCDARGSSLLTCFVDGYLFHGDPYTAEEEALRAAHDECDYDFWDSFVSERNRTPLEQRASGILAQLDFLLAQGADPNLCVMVDGMTETPLMLAVCGHDYYLSRYLLEHGADPGVWLFEESRQEQRDREYWLMDELDISVLQGDKGEALELTLHLAGLLWQYGLRDWQGLCIDVDAENGVVNGHPPKPKF